MGQKTHPLGFRLGITQDHKSAWYANFNQYANILEEDDKIRTYINSIAKTNNIANVNIYRNGLNDQIQLNIETGKPGILVGELGTGLENLLNNLKKILPTSRQVTIKVFATFFSFVCDLFVTVVSCFFPVRLKSLEKGSLALFRDRTS